MFEENPFYRSITGLEPALSTNMGRVVVIVVLLIGLVIAFRSKVKRRPHRNSKRGPYNSRLFFKDQITAIRPRASLNAKDMHLPEHQMRAIAAASFETQPLLNKSEARLLPVIESALAEIGRGHRVMAQTSLGELLRPCHQQDSVVLDCAYAAINAKRLDFSVIDRSGRLVIAIEYQGGGHYSSTAFIRDAVKREACRKAGVAFIEVLEGTMPSDLKEQVKTLLVATPTISATS